MAMQYFVYDFRGFRSQRKATHTPTHIGVIGDPGEETGDANTKFGDPLVFEASDATSHSASDPLRTLIESESSDATSQTTAPIYSLVVYNHS